MRTTTAAVALSITIKAEVMDVVRPLSELVPVVCAVAAKVSSGVIMLVRATLMAVSSAPRRRLVATIRSVKLRVEECFRAYHWQCCPEYLQLLFRGP